ncbi:MAG: hypothetical protein U0414_13990 [Polyangiaceae bacterium]
MTPPTTGARVRGAWRMILANYAFRALAGIAGASAIVEIVSPFVAQRPDGDRDLFANGAALFLGMGLRALPRLGGVARTEALVAVGVALLGVVPFAALLHALVAPHASIGDRAREALRLGLKLALLLGIAALVEAVCVGLAVLMVSLVDHPGDSPANLASAAGLSLVGLVPLALVAILHDLARVAVVARRRSVLDALGHAARVMRRKPGAVLLLVVGGWMASTLCAALGFAAAGWIGLRSDARVVAVLVLQQLAVLGILAVRAVYFARLITIDAEVR